MYDDGWTVKNTKGSHVQLTHPIKPGKVTLSKKYGKESLPPGTLDSIWEQAGWE
ncbi:hypothetical protein BW716_34715 [[Flexibacter] sp. ATCC 35208]|nr:hypothetical protein BW716_34715 [[Flexibacter] sp. ATCC 35208]